MAQKHQNKFYFAKVVEIMRDDLGEVTYGLRVRVPSIHGSTERGVPDTDCPIAKPMMIPGSIMNKASFETSTPIDTVLYVIFDRGNLSSPIYFGLSVDLTTLDTSVFDLPYATETTKGVIRAKVVGTTGYIFTTDHQTVVAYINYDGTVLQTADYDLGADLSGITAPTDPTRTGHTFDAWDSVVPAIMPGTDVIVTATYIINQYTLEYIDWNTNVLQSTLYDFGEDLTLVTAPEEPTRIDYTFSGWDIVVASTMPANNVTITATYIAD